MSEKLSEELNATKEEHLKLLDNPIAAGDLANEAGKSYMKGLFKAIDNHAKYNRKKLWIMVKIEKEMWDKRAIKISFGVMDKPLTFMRESMDLWEYDYTEDKLKLCWSLPHRVEMKNFLRAPEKYSKDLIKWINLYLKQENLDLEDSSSIKLSVK